MKTLLYLLILLMLPIGVWSAPDTTRAYCGECDYDHLSPYFNIDEGYTYYHIIPFVKNCEKLPYNCQWECIGGDLYRICVTGDGKVDVTQWEEEIIRPLKGRADTTFVYGDSLYWQDGEKFQDTLLYIRLSKKDELEPIFNPLDPSDEYLTKAGYKKEGDGSWSKKGPGFKSLGNGPGPLVGLQRLRSDYPTLDTIRVADTALIDSPALIAKPIGSWMAGVHYSITYRDSTVQVCDTVWVAYPNDTWVKNAKTYTVVITYRDSVVVKEK